MSSKNPNKRSVSLGRIPNVRNTSVTISASGWEKLKVLAEARGMNRSELIDMIDRDRADVGLSDALRRFINREAAKEVAAAPQCIERAA